MSRSTKCEPTKPAPPVTALSTRMKRIKEAPLTQDSLSLSVGEELDRGELGNGGVLDRVGVLVVVGLGSVVLGSTGDILGVVTLLDVGRGL